MEKNREGSGPILEVKDLRMSFVTRSGVVQAIDSVSFHIDQGETFGLVGETGCGKSQTAMAVMRLTPEAGIIEGGQILFQGTDLLTDVGKESKKVMKGGRIRLRRREDAIKKMNNRMSHIRGRLIAMIFQEPMTSLNPVYSIGFQISEVLVTHRKHYLLARVQARNRASTEDLKSVAALISKSDYTDDQLLPALQKLGIEGLEDEVRFIANRTDIGRSQKVRLISELADVKTSPLRMRFLLREEQSTNSSIVYRLLFWVPGFKRWVQKPMQDEALNISQELLTQVRMPNAATVLSQHPHELSGGMRQRVMIAMGVAAKPKLLIADEPTSALDVTIQAQILDLFRELRDEMNMSVLFISHDMGVIAETCDRVGVMYAGNIVEVATVEELFENPKHPYTQGLLAAIPKFDDSKKPLQSIPGTVPNLINPPSGCRFRTRCAYAFDRCSETPPLIKVGEDHEVLCWLYDEGEKGKHGN